jgi:hypothetical protein
LIGSTTVNWKKTALPDHSGRAFTFAARRNGFFTFCLQEKLVSSQKKVRIQ